MEPDLKDKLGDPLTRKISAAPVANAERRQTVLRVMTDLFVFDEGSMTDKERALHGDVLAGLIGEAGLTMRKEVGERLAVVRYAPPKVVRFLAADDIAVAGTILTHSPALSNDDLVAIAQSTTREHRIAIAARPRLESSLVSALIITGEDEVFEALAKNPGAQINEAGLTRIAARSLNNVGLAEALTNRDDLNGEALMGLFWTASPEMREKIIALVSPPSETGSGLARAPIRNGSEEERRTALEGLSSLLIARKLNDFQRIMGQLLGVTGRLMEKIMTDPEGEPFAIACRAAGFPNESFTTLLLLYNPLVSESIKRVFALTELYDRLSPASSWYFLDTWNKDSSGEKFLDEIKLKPAIHDQLTKRTVSVQRAQFEQKVAHEVAALNEGQAYGNRRAVFGRRGA